MAGNFFSGGDSALEDIFSFNKPAGTLYDKKRNLDGKPVYTPPTPKPAKQNENINHAPVPGTGAPIVSNNPIQSASPFFSSGGPAGNVSPPDNQQKSSPSFDWRKIGAVGIVIVLLLFLGFKFLK